MSRTRITNDGRKLIVRSEAMVDPTTPSDVELLQLIVAGSEDAFVTLYRRHANRVYRFALQMSGSATIAEDVTQEVFMVLMREAVRYDAARATLSTYLYGVTRNHVLRYLGRDRCQSQFDDDAADDDAAGGSEEELIVRDDPLSDLARREMIERVRAAVLALPARYREVVVLCDLHEMSYGEAAAVLDCAVGTIRSRLHRGRALLVEKLRATQTVDQASPKVGSARCLA